MFYCDFDIISLYFLGAMLFFVIIAIACGMAPWRRASENESDFYAPANAESDERIPMISVVVYSEDSEEDIIRCIEQIRAQECDRYEIIVVCRTSMENRNILAARMAEYPDVYVTFIPPGSHNLSERKLAITIGLKAAKGDVVLTTTSNIIIPSSEWLARMREPFIDPDVELVLGYSHMDFAEMKGAGKWYRQFDSLLGSAQWISAARNAKPYRGDGINLAFRRNTFFEHKGFAKSMYLHYGDDDLFVHELANASNTKTVVNHSTILTSIWGEDANRMWKLRKERYQFTARWLPRAPFAKVGFLSFLQWLIPCLGVAAAIIGLPSLIPAVAAGIIWIGFQLKQISEYRRLAEALEAKKLWFAVPIFMSLHPILNALFRSTHRKGSRTFYTWQR